MNDLAALNIRFLSVTGEPCGEHLFPPHLKLSFDVSGAVLQVSAACSSADLRGGFRSVCLLGPSTRLSAMVFKLGRSVEDNVQEVRSTELCPCAAFTRIFAHGGATLQLGDHSVYHGHFILAERVLPLRQVLRTGGIKARTLAMVALGCLQGWCRASQAGIRVRDVGEKHWGLKENSSSVVNSTTSFCNPGWLPVRSLW